MPEIASFDALSDRLDDLEKRLATSMIASTTPKIAICFAGCARVSPRSSIASRLLVRAAMYGT
jgi:hypothetical protein